MEKVTMEAFDLFLKVHYLMFGDFTYLESLDTLKIRICFRKSVSYIT